MSDQEAKELKREIRKLKIQRRDMCGYIEAIQHKIGLFKLNKMTNLPYGDQARWKKHMAVISEIRKNNSNQKTNSWGFYVTSISTNIVFYCFSPVQFVTKTELYQLVVSNLPFGVTIGEISSKVSCTKSIPIGNEIDFAITHSFMCN